MLAEDLIFRLAKNRGYNLRICADISHLVLVKLFTTGSLFWGLPSTDFHSFANFRPSNHKGRVAIQANFGLFLGVFGLFPGAMAHDA